MKIYLDTCCLNRPFDDQSQDRIRMESEAILIILYHLYSSGWEWFGSTILEHELEEISDLEKRTRVKLLATYVHDSVEIQEAELERGEQLEKIGFDSADALHIACAENAGVSILLTTDDKFLKLAQKNKNKLSVEIHNPVIWLMEVLKQ